MSQIELVELRPDPPYFKIERPYETIHNVTGKVLYKPGENPPRLERQAAKQLIRAVNIFRSKGVGFVVLDVLRTQYAHDCLMEVEPNPENVNPDSGHLEDKATAVDCNLIHIDSGEYFDMGTKFDEFGKRSHVGATSLEPYQEMNRAILSGVMAHVGFRQWPYEWWHFDFVGTNSRGR